MSYEYANGVKMSFTQVFFHPGGMPGGGQYFYAYGTKGAVDVSNARFYPVERGVQPQVLSEAQGRRGGEPQLAAFYECIPHRDPARSQRKDRGGSGADGDPGP